MKLTSKGRYAIMAMADLAKNDVKEPNIINLLDLKINFYTSIHVMAIGANMEMNFQLILS